MEDTEIKVINAEEFREWIEKRYGDKERVERLKSDAEILSEIRSEYNCFNEEEEQKYRALSDAIQALNSLKHGKWIDEEINIFCSECNHGSPIGAKWPYCPNCGAKMEEGNDRNSDE